MKGLKLNDKYFRLLDTLLRENGFPLTTTELGGKAGSHHAEYLVRMRAHGLVVSRKYGNVNLWALTDAGLDVVKNFRRTPPLQAGRETTEQRHEP